MAAIYNPENYFTKLTEEDIKVLPASLKEGHEFVVLATNDGANWTAYRTEAEIKETIDLYFSKLSEWKTERNRTKRAKNVEQSIEKEGKNQGSNKSKPQPPPKKQVESHSLEYKFIQRYVRLHDKVKTANSIRLFIRAMQLAITEKQITKASPLKDEINYIQKQLVEIYESMKDEQKIVIPADDLNKFLGLIGKEEQMLSVRLIKSYINLQGKTIEKVKAKNLYNRIVAAINKKRLTEKDKYYSKIETIMKSLKELATGKKESGVLKISKAELNGLNGVLDGCGCSDGLAGTPSNSLNGFTPIGKIGQNGNTSTFRLPGDLGELFGDLERYRLAITVEGDQGAGKTRFTYQVADGFADLGFNIGIYSLEIGGRSDLIERMRDEYISPKNIDNILISGEAENGIQTIRKNANNFDVIIIDSWNKLDAHSKEFDSLRKQFPNTIWIVIFQRIGSGDIRGGIQPLYDAGINIEVVKAKGGDEFNYAHATKNRYAMTGIKYLVFQQELLEE